MPILLHGFMKDFLSFKKDKRDPGDGLFLLFLFYFISFCFSDKAMLALNWSPSSLCGLITFLVAVIKQSLDQAP